MCNDNIGAPTEVQLSRWFGYGHVWVSTYKMYAPMFCWAPNVAQSSQSWVHPRYVRTDRKGDQLWIMSVACQYNRKNSFIL